MSDAAPFDLLVHDIDWLVTVDAGRRVIRDAAIGVRDGRIVAIGKSADLAIHPAIFPVLDKCRPGTSRPQGFFVYC